MTGDFLRFWRDSILWNLRKSRFVLRGRRGVAPCQHPSDSGRAGETACVACIGWQRPARFARVCPLLERRAGEWRCAVAASAVRPFWGRALVAVVLAAVVAWVAGTGVVFGVVRAVGYREFRYADLWTTEVRARFRAAQGAFYERAAQSALARGELGEGILALSIAYERNPRDWRTGLLLGQLLARTRQYGAADRVFEALVGSFPERSDEFAEVWCDMLILRGEPEPLLRLALPRLRGGRAGAGAWLRVATASLRRVRDAAAFERWCDELAGALPEAWRDVAAVERALRRGEVARLPERLNGVVPVRSAVLAWYRCATLVELAAWREALAQVELNQDELGRFHTGLLRARIAAGQGAAVLEEMTFENLAEDGMTPVKAGLLCAELVRRPSVPSCRALLAASRTLPVEGGVAGALQVAARACGVEWPADLQARFGPVPAVVEQVAGPRSPAVVRTVLHAVPLPREVMLALVESAETDRPHP